MRDKLRGRDIFGIGLVLLLAVGRLTHSQALVPGSTTPVGTAFLSPGASFAINRTAIIDGGGRIGAAAGSPTDCVLVDGTSTPCSSGGGGGGGANFAGNETPGQTSTLVYTLVHTPSPAGLLQLYLNGLLMTQGVDYTLSGLTITFVSAYSEDLASAQTMTAFYQY